jgi:hypothetical protein
VLLARFVVEQRTTLNGLLDAGFVDASDAQASGAAAAPSSGD